MTCSEIRQQFFNFFSSKEHAIVSSAPIVVKNDPTLMFTNAGMNQFKDYFLGNKQSPHLRVADTQKCLRVSGKHNDLEEVGVDTYHHTMFEMLGNWSFGNYFKKEAIAWSWELLTDVYKIDKERIYVSVFEGDAAEGLPFDEEAANEWKKWIAEDRIIKGKRKIIFWEMGDTGPCGPCSEIHVDCRPDEERKTVDGKTLVNADHPQVIEIWNNVFMQFNRKKDGRLEPLPAKHVDTGMGFERLVRVLQSKNSNYDTDVFSGTIRATEAITAQRYDYGNSKQAITFRVLADHIRAISFTIADGQLPSNAGAGYVIRRILRRAVRYYYSYLHYKQPLLHRLVPVLATQFENVFPELKQQAPFVEKVIKEEEESFLRTLEKGLKRIDDIINFSKENTLCGKEVFELYDTYGFPLDLTKLIASENKIIVDEAGFEAEMKQQKERSRAATAIDTDDWILVSEDTSTHFVGYEQLKALTRVIKYRIVTAKGKQQYQIVLATTPFYPESGGQLGDKGFLRFGEEKIPVTDTRKENDLIVHFTNTLPTSVGGEVLAVVNQTDRQQTNYNHTATHLLHAVLKQVLGAHVNQKGSLVSPNVLRFDVSHFAKISDEEINQVTEIVNQKIRENIPVIIKEMPKDEALKLGATALFGEKYSDVVRVVSIDPNFSVELCGGTHVPQTGSIGLFVITSESAVAAGVRRIEALTAQTALHHVAQKLHEHKQINELLKTKDPLSAVEKLFTNKAAAEKKIEQLETKALLTIGNELLKNAQTINQVNFIGSIVTVSHAEALKKLCTNLKNHLQNLVVVLCANIGGKPFVAVSVAENIITNKNLDAAQIIKQHIAPLIKGAGADKKTLATAGGQDASNLQNVIRQVKALL